MLNRLGNHAYAVEEKSAEYLIDPDFDPDKKNLQQAHGKQQLTRPKFE